MKKFRKIISIITLVVLFSTFANAQIGKLDNTRVNVTVNTNGLIDDDCIDEVKIVFTTSNNTHVSTKPFTGNGVYGFDAWFDGPGTITPSLIMDCNMSGLTFVLSMYSGDWDMTGGPDIPLSIEVIEEGLGGGTPGGQ